VLLLGFGLIAGLVPALLAIAPALRQRSAALPVLSVAPVATALVVVGAIISSGALAVIRRLSLLASLRSE